MKKFILRVTIFTMIAAVAATAIELFVRSLPNSYRLKHEWMTNNAGRVETIILGNSHALFALRPDMMPPNTFNLANVSQTLDYDLLLLEKYAPQCRRLKTVIITADNSNMFDPSADEAEPNRATFYRLYMDISRHSLLSKYGLELLSAATVQAKLQKHIAHSDLDVDSLGWGNTYISARRDADMLLPQNAEKRMEAHTCSNWNNAMTNRQHLIDIAKYCSQHNIHLIILCPPTSKQYNILMPKHQVRFINVTLDMLRKHNATVIDMHDDKTFSDADFFDADHMTDKGAAKLSKMIVKHAAL